MAHITIIGTGHIFDLASQIKDIIKILQPQVVGVELDRNRHQSLCTPSQGNRRGIPVVYAILAWMQRSLAQRYGVKPGAEMLAAWDAAVEQQAQTVYLDMNAQRILALLWQSMSLNVKLKILLSIFASAFVRKKDIERNLDNFEGDPASYFSHLEKNFPEIKRILIDMRDNYMAQRLHKLTGMYERIIAVVGEGHTWGIHQALEKQDIPHTIVHIGDLQKGKWQDIIKDIP